ncbi:TonB-dependent receptor plug domain-containing protein [Kineobactrum salinum]|uniref:TonB-dependent receptor plug domain-containing protein n=1 Tax=Kineobactrum salinum TaxID=2708301 RepID=UPI0018D89F60|nr:TonB-dependent receptor plug domain-containing protein [Kineobactrum salinum]
MKNYRKKILGSRISALVLAVPFSLPGVVLAQVADSRTKSAAALEEVVVTARRRAESIQTAPLSVSAFSTEAIERRNMNSAADVTNFVPNVQFDSAASESGGGASSQINIRGIGQTDYVITVEPGVGVYLDGVYVGKSMGSLLDTIDVERLEVLRGPRVPCLARTPSAVQSRYPPSVPAKPSRLPRISLSGPTTAGISRVLFRDR